MGRSSARWQSNWGKHYNLETDEMDGCCVRLMVSTPNGSFPEWRSFLELCSFWENAFSYVNPGFYIKFTVLFNIWKEPAQEAPNGLNWIVLDNCTSEWYPTLRNDKSPFHFRFNRITELHVVCVLLQEGESCMGTVQCVPNVSVCCMNYQWEDGCGLAELKRFRLRCPLTAHWFDISIIDSRGDSDSWAAQSQLFSWFEASWTCSQVEGLVGDY